MLLKQNISVLGIVRSTWKMDIFLLLTCITVYYLHEYVVNRAVQIPGTLATLLGTAIAFFVGFNNNQSYDRWWEARIIWGALVNDSRTWARNLLTYTSASSEHNQELMSLKRKMIRRQIGFVYALKQTLRKTTDGYFEKFLSKDEVEAVKRESNVANAIQTLHAVDLQKLSDQKHIDDFRFVQLSNTILAFTDHMGKSERIKNTIFPTSYISFTKLFIWILVVFMTLNLADTIGGWSILIGWTVGFVFHVSHQNGMALMDPFDNIPTGIPLDQISRTIEINLLEMLGEENVPAPVQPVNEEYIM